MTVEILSWNKRVLFTHEMNSWESSIPGVSPENVPCSYDYFWMKLIVVFNRKHLISMTWELLSKFLPKSSDVLKHFNSSCCSHLCAYVFIVGTGAGVSFLFFPFVFHVSFHFLRELSVCLLCSPVRYLQLAWNSSYSIIQ